VEGLGMSGFAVAEELERRFHIVPELATQEVGSGGRGWGGVRAKGARARAGWGDAVPAGARVQAGRGREG